MVAEGLATASARGCGAAAFSQFGKDACSLSRKQHLQSQKFESLRFVGGSLKASSNSAGRIWHKEAACRRPREIRNRKLADCTTRCSLSGAASGSPAESDNPYEVLGVNPLRGFDAAKAAYKKKYKDAERKGDEAEMARVERAYDSIMMSQLSKRRQGIAFGSLEVSDSVKYADRQDLFPWRPREERVSKNEMLINAAIAAPLALWMLSAGYAEWKPLQLLTFAFMFRMHMKLKDFFVVPSGDEDEDREKRKKVNFQRLLRSVCLVFGCVLLSATIFTATLSFFDFIGAVAPKALLRGQELVVTVLSAIFLFIVASFYR